MRTCGRTALHRKGLWKSELRRKHYVFRRFVANGQQNQKFEGASTHVSLFHSTCPGYFDDVIVRLIIKEGSCPVQTWDSCSYPEQKKGVWRIFDQGNVLVETTSVLLSLEVWSFHSPSGRFDEIRHRETSDKSGSIDLPKMCSARTSLFFFKAFFEAFP